MFTPCKVPKGLGPERGIGSVRTTFAQFEDGEVVKIGDNWKDSKEAHRCMSESWVGITIFKEMQAQGGGRWEW